MTTKEFLDRYDSASEVFTEQELEDLWWDDLFEDYIPKLAREVESGEPDRWQIPQDKIIKIEDRYFMIYRWRAATEYEETTYDCQPEEVRPAEKVVTIWETMDIKQPIDYYEEYKNKKLWTDTEIAIAETISHLENQIEIYQNFKNKYPINFDYLYNAGIAVLDLVKSDCNFNKRVRLGIR